MPLLRFFLGELERVRRLCEHVALDELLDFDLVALLARAVRIARFELISRHYSSLQSEM